MVEPLAEFRIAYRRARRAAALAQRPDPAQVVRMETRSGAARRYSRTASEPREADRVAAASVHRIDWRRAAVWARGNCADARRVRRQSRLRGNARGHDDPFPRLGARRVPRVWRYSRRAG